MSCYPINVDQIISWFRSKTASLEETGITLADIHANTANVPSARADFDAESKIGRISFWATGEVDFEVLRRSDGKFALFRHESVPSLQTAELDYAYDEFVNAMRSTPPV
jgi:hypothetical protein